MILGAGTKGVAVVGFEDVAGVEGVIGTESDISVLEEYCTIYLYIVKNGIDS